jgi:polyisoprenoid-binding protein YceI
MNTITTTATQTTWGIDLAHSELQFKVKHLMISTVTGSFTQFSGTVETNGADFEQANIAFEAEIESLQTGNSQRDEHLKSSEFFDAGQFPVMKFKSTSFTKIKDDTYRLEGEFTLKGITRSVTLEAEYGGGMTDPYGNEKSGFELNGKISRKDFGLNWNALTEAGGVVVSDEVKIHANIQLIKTNG